MKFLTTELCHNKYKFIYNTFVPLGLVNSFNLISTCFLYVISSYTYIRLIKVCFNKTPKAHNVLINSY